MYDIDSRTGLDYSKNISPVKQTVHAALVAVSIIKVKEAATRPSMIA